MSLRDVSTISRLWEDCGDMILFFPVLGCRYPVSAVTGDPVRSIRAAGATIMLKVVREPSSRPSGSNPV